MALQILCPEIVGISESSLTIAFDVDDEHGSVDSAAELWLDGERRTCLPGRSGTRILRIEELEPDREYALEVRAGAARSEPGDYFPPSVRTHPDPVASEAATFATLNDLHFGEPMVGGVLNDDMESGGQSQPGFPLARADDTDEPYWRFMNEDAIGEINESGVDCAFVKGDIADRGLPWQFEEAARAFARFAMPHHAFLGNHDYLAKRSGDDVDGYALLGQPRAPRSVELGGWQLILLETSLPGEHHGVFEAERLEWLADTLSGPHSREPTLVLMHHQPVPPEHRDRYPNRIGLKPEHSLPFFDCIGQNPQVRAVLIGHTHRNRLRTAAASGATPYVEVQCSKDYPGGWAHYRLFEDGSFRQEVRRTSSARALAHSRRCRDFYNGFYRHFALGPLEARSFALESSPGR